MGRQFRDKIHVGQRKQRQKKRPDGEKASLTTRKHTGLTDILSHIGKASGIDAHIRLGGKMGGKIHDRIKTR